MSKAGRPNVGSVGRWIMVGSEIPVMVVAGAYIGQYLGKQIPWIAPFSVFIGAFLGFGIGVYNTYKVIQVLERRERVGGSFAKKPLVENVKHEEADRRRKASRDILELLRAQQREAEGDLGEPQKLSDCCSREK